MKNLSVDKCMGEDCPCKLRKKTAGEMLSEVSMTMGEALSNIRLNFPKFPPPSAMVVQKNPYIAIMQDQLQGMLLEEDALRRKRAQMFHTYYD